MSFPHRTAFIVLSTAVTAAPAVPDEVFLHGDGRVSGVIMKRTESAVSIETAPGRLTLSMKRVERIVESRSSVEVFQERAGELGARDVAGWAELARWAADRDLVTPSREAWQRVLAVDPAHPEANEALGRVQLEGEWMSQGEAYRAQGYVEYEGRWVTPAEHEALVRERAAEEAAEREGREADLRVREAEARAREAEARAREAESAANASIPDGSIPIWWGGGTGLPFYPSGDGDHDDGDTSGGRPHDGHGGRPRDPDGRPRHPQAPNPAEPAGRWTPRTHAPSAVEPATSGPAQPTQVGGRGERSNGGSAGRWANPN